MNSYLWRSASLLAVALALVATAPHWRAGAAAEEAPRVLAKASGPIVLRDEPVWVPLIEAGTGRGITGETLRQRSAGQRVVLMLNEVAAKAPPATAFAVYVGPASTERGSLGGAHHAGRLAFYGEISHGTLEAAPSFRSFDVTDALQRLLARGVSADPLGVAIIAERKLAANASATIGSIELVVP